MSLGADDGFRAFERNAGRNLHLTGNHVVVAADGDADGNLPADGLLQLLHIHAKFTVQPPAELAVRADGAGDGTLVNRRKDGHPLLVQAVHCADVAVLVAARQVFFDGLIAFLVQFVQRGADLGFHRLLIALLVDFRLRHFVAFEDANVVVDAPERPLVRLFQCLDGLLLIIQHGLQGFLLALAHSHHPASSSSAGTSASTTSAAPSSDFVRPQIVL